MLSESSILLATAASVGVVHTLLGPDHYLPFLFMSRAGRWSRTRTLLITVACGLGHVVGSVALGFLGIALGLALTSLEFVESMRGQLATWLLIAFGLVYAIWGLRRAQRHKPHTHAHVHADGTLHRHEHVHQEEHLHVHAPEATLRSQAGTTADAGVLRLTPWVLFTIFVFGPCEPLIPLLMYPAAQLSLGTVFLVALVFGASTIATMCLVVTLCLLGIERLPVAPLERYTHALAGTAILFCGLGMQFLGL